MDLNLSELEGDIGRLSLQQEQIQKAKNTFYLHGAGDSSGGESDGGKRRTWGSNSASSGCGNSGRNQWGPPRPFLAEKEPTPSRSIFNGKGAAQDNGPTNGNSMPSSSFRLHTNVDSQGNRLFSRNRQVVELKFE